MRFSQIISDGADLGVLTQVASLSDTGIYVDNGAELGVPVMALGAALWSDERSGAMSNTQVEGETHDVRTINDDIDWG
ncbi:hypothetical protein U1Q18_001349 [Sarracenia purpurea var. burkii]